MSETTRIDHPKNEWRWYGGTDEERLDYGPMLTREDAIEEVFEQEYWGCLDEEMFRICECLPPEPDEDFEDDCLEDGDYIFPDHRNVEHFTFAEARKLVEAIRAKRNPAEGQVDG